MRILVAMDTDSPKQEERRSETSAVSTRGEEEVGVVAQRSESRLDARALREGWPVSARMREAVLRRALSTVESEEASPGQATAAGRLIIAADALNAKREIASKSDERADMDARRKLLAELMKRPDAKAALLALTAAQITPETDATEPGETAKTE